nr:hypothetical protein [Geomicrobium sp. JCM 19037]
MSTDQVQGDVIDEKQKQELIQKYDRESNVRQNLGKWIWIAAIIGISLTSFHLYTGLRGTFGSLMQGAVHLGSGLALIYILYPINRKASKKIGVPFYDAILALASLYCCFYIVWNYDYLTSAVLFGFSTHDQIVALAAILLLLEATRRAVGMPIVIIAVLAMLYGVYGSASWLGVFSHPGFTWEQWPHDSSLRPSLFLEHRFKYLPRLSTCSFCLGFYLLERISVSSLMILLFV